MRTFISTVVVVFLVLSVATAAIDRREIELKAPDGVMLSASYYLPAPDRLGPAMLLLHQCNRDRQAWNELASDLATAGIKVLTLDFRGYGTSGGDQITGVNAQAQAQRETVMKEKGPGDVDAAFGYLLSQKTVDRSRVAIGGAGCAVAPAADAAMRHKEVIALMVLSGAAGDQARAYVSQTPGLAVFGASGENETTGDTSKPIKDIVAASKNLQSTVKTYPGFQPGVLLFSRFPDLEPLIVNWLKTQLVSATPPTK
jgi:dienelactone hydrolase